MKQSDLHLLLKLENIQINQLQKELQEVHVLKNKLADEKNKLNNNFINAEPDLDIRNFGRYVALENKKMENKLEDFSEKILTLQDKIQESLTQEKKYDILLEKLEQERRKKLEVLQENRSQEFTTFQFRNQ